MTLSARDRKNISVDSLIGFCLSAPAILTADKAGRLRWVNSIVAMANALAEKIDHPSVGKSDE